jgi:hypothetical protein
MIARYPGREDHGRPGYGGQQAGSPLAKDGRIEAGLAVGKIEGRAALPGFPVDGVSIVDEPVYVRDGIVEQQVAAAALDREGLVEIRRCRRIERDERPIRAVDMLCWHFPGRSLRCRDDVRWKIIRYAELPADSSQPVDHCIGGVDQGLHRQP